jgi:hypothetical protein
MAQSSNRPGHAAVASQTLKRQGAGTVFRLLNEKLGQNVRLRLRRGGEERELAA